MNDRRWGRKVRAVGCCYGQWWWVAYAAFEQRSTATLQDMTAPPPYFPQLKCSYVMWSVASCHVDISTLGRWVCHSETHILSLLKQTVIAICMMPGIKACSPTCTLTALEGTGPSGKGLLLASGSFRLGERWTDSRWREVWQTDTQGPLHWWNTNGSESFVLLPKMLSCLMVAFSWLCLRR